MFEDTREYIKCLIADLLKWLTRNETWLERMSTLRNVLGSNARMVRFVFALTCQCPRKQRGHMKRVTGHVKGTWFARDAKKRSEIEIASANGPVVFFMHGGAFLSGNTRMWSEWTLYMMDTYKRQNTSQELRFFYVDYTLVPDARFPVQWNESQAAYDYLVRQLGIPPRQLFLAGDSAGGNLALQTMHELEKPKAHGGLIVFSPWGFPCMSLINADLVEDVKGRKFTEDNSWFANIEHDYVAEPFGRQGVVEYIGPDRSTVDACESKQINPFLRTDAELAELPDTLCIYGEGECLRDQIDEWVKRMQKAGCKIDAVRHHRGVHDWALDLRSAQEPEHHHEYVRYTCKWIRSRLD